MHPVAAVMLLSASLSPPALVAPPGEAPSGEERWFEFTIREIPCGFMSRSTTREGEVLTTRTLERLSVQRSGVPIRTTTTTRFRETTDGRPLRVELTRERGGSDARRCVIDFDDALITVTTDRSSGDERVQRLPDPGGWLTPARADAHVRRQVRAGAPRIEYRVLRTTGVPGTIQDVEMTRLADEETGSAGEPSDPRSHWAVRRSGEALEFREWRDPAGRLLGSELVTGLGPIRTTHCSPEHILTHHPVPGPELMTEDSLLGAAPALDTDDSRTGGYRVHLVGSPGLLDRLPANAGAQRARRIGEGAWEFELDASRSSPDEAAASDPVFTEASRILDSTDPLVVEFARRSLEGTGPDRLTRAERLRVAVGRHIRDKGLASTFDTASEVVRSRSGDCTEHAVLLAAALRADGTPSRVAVGLVNAADRNGSGQRFQWHMWTQGLVDGRWHDLDPTRPRRFDAGHLLFAVDPLCDDCLPRPYELLLGLVGRVRVEPLMIDGAPLAPDGAPR